MADHPLRPATDRRLGAPLPHQLANRTRADPSAINLSPSRKGRTYPVLAQVSLSYSEPKGTFPRVTHPSAAPYCYGARLACVRPAASVRSEPGSNSQVEEFEPDRSHTLGNANRSGLSTTACASRRGPETSSKPRSREHGADRLTTIFCFEINVTVGCLLMRPFQGIECPFPKRRKAHRRPRFSFFRFKCQTAGRAEAEAPGRTTFAPVSPPGGLRLWFP